MARRAGVSIATASRALSGRRRVTPDVADRVQRAAEELDYRPNTVAQALRGQSTRIVGMVVPGIGDPFFTQIVEAVEHDLAGSGRELLLCDSRHDPAIEARRVRALLERQVDGLVITPCDATASVPAVREAARSVPTVQMDRYVEGDVTDWVGVDDESGVNQAVAHLADRGARRVAFVGGAPAGSTARVRLEAFERAVAARPGVTVAARALGDFSVEHGRRAARELHASGDLPDAILCGNDQIAVGLLRELRAAGVRVPADVSVAGFDDIGYAALTDPPLTTVRQPVPQLATEAVRLLTAPPAPARPPCRIAVSPTLVIRASTSP
ncbi:LacI family DNA-binding transcriptional regulator [Bailinhaonella thermotolerans]|uniref:LacI family DNA-binding transcriptional regulator n=1 Tax=Bailinhaonella thermotolerans TaxID=1070861 RepID=UPI001F5B6864|nr:LacI family DNA-binding transcriptional regulator [Bailinhaonella thermotolerans]